MKLLCCVGALLLAGQCGDSPAPEPEESVEEVAEPELAPDEDDEELDEDDPLDEPPRALSEDQIEAMSRGELEAACYQGSTAACDALGH